MPGERQFGRGRGPVRWQEGRSFCRGRPGMTALAPRGASRKRQEAIFKSLVAENLWRQRFPFGVPEG